MPSGVVLELSRWPVKSLGGERLRAARVDSCGVGGDRHHFLRSRGKPLSARLAPKLLLWRASYPSAPDDALDPADVPLATVTSPGERVYEWGDPSLAEDLAADLRRPVELERDRTAGHDEPGTILVTIEATRRAVEEALGRPLDIRRFRTNLHLGLDAEPFAEEEWVGRRIDVGGASFVVDHLCDRCAVPTRDPDTAEKWPELLKWLDRERALFFGVRVKAVGPARVEVGDPVEVASA